MIRFENVTLTFDKKTILSRFSLNIQKGDKILITGKSGIGKSTLLKMVLGFVTPDQGTLYFRNKPFQLKTAWEIRRITSYVSQNLEMGSGPVYNLIHDILAYKANRLIQEKKIKPEKFLNLLELKQDILESDLETISGGEKQRIAILTALLLKRNLFLLDEPTAFLDTDLKNKMAAFFSKKKDWTILVISHDACWMNNDQFKMIRLGR